MSEPIDLLVVGGGVNGTGIARDAVGRGLSVIMVEKDDLAEGTSSRSGKLVHGGLRYLEYYEFRLVREALIEREVLLESAPHIIWPMRFVLPHSPIDRPAWFVRLGLFLYDHLGGRKRLPGTRTLDLHTDPEGEPLKDDYSKAFEYSDCWVDDARLVVLNAIDARDKGASVLTRTACVSARRDGDIWSCELMDSETGIKRTVKARALVNAAGPWISQFVGQIAGVNSSRNIRLVKGSHIIVPKFWDRFHAYLIQNTDKRVIFVIPYEGDKALIGTTDISYEGRPEDVHAEGDEIDYLIKIVNRYFKEQLSRDDVLHTFSGIRPLYDDNEENPSAVTRDYMFEVDGGAGKAPLLNVFGGKITTFRKLSEHALAKLRPFFPNMGGNWTKNAHLPGGDIPDADFDAFRGLLAEQFPFAPRVLLNHYSRLYGTRTNALLGDASSIADLGTQFGPVFHECEARYLIDHEWAQTPQDILERRTKHGLHMNEQEIAAFESWFSGVAAKAS